MSVRAPLSTEGSREQALNWRLFIWEPPAWVLTDLASASLDAASEKHFVGLVYLHMVRRDRLTFDFVTQALWKLWRSDARTVRRTDVMDFMAENISWESARWRESTRVKLERRWCREGKLPQPGWWPAKDKG